MKMIVLVVNNKSYELNVNDGVSLLQVLRHHLDLTGSKYGCGEGTCGACTVMVDGTAVRSCMVQAGTVVGKKITTIEGLEKEGALHPVQAACLEVDVFQCAYCASGMIMSAVSLLGRKPKPTREDIVNFMQGNICRCGTYTRMMKAIQKAAQA